MKVKNLENENMALRDEILVVKATMDSFVERVERLEEKIQNENNVLKQIIHNSCEKDNILQAMKLLQSNVKERLDRRNFIDKDRFKKIRQMYKEIAGFENYLNSESNGTTPKSEHQLLEQTPSQQNHISRILCLRGSLHQNKRLMTQERCRDVCT